MGRSHKVFRTEDLCTRLEVTSPIVLYLEQQLLKFLRLLDTDPGQPTAVDTLEERRCVGAAFRCPSDVLCLDGLTFLLEQFLFYYLRLAVYPL